LALLGIELENIPLGQRGTDISNASFDATMISTGDSTNAATMPSSKFCSDLQAVGKDCGTTLPPPPPSFSRATSGIANCHIYDNWFIFRVSPSLGGFRDPRI
jgi:hypothetical protein